MCCRIATTLIDASVVRKVAITIGINTSVGFFAPFAARIAITACIGIAALAAGTQKWLLGAMTQWERWTMIVAGLLLVYPAPAADFVGLGGIALVVAAQWLRRPKVQTQ